MKIAVVSYTETGARQAAAAAEALSEKHAVWLFRFRQEFSETGALMQTYFRTYDAWIFVCACGIAVRAVAPYLDSKQTDPAVVVLDEGAHFAIPLLSGHIGGANALAKRLAALTGAVPAVTTATDTGGRFSPDSFAAANHLLINDLGAAKEIASAVLAGEKIGVMSDWPVEHLSEECIVVKAPETGGCRTGICISAFPKENPFPVTLQLFPKNLVLGIGCRQGISEEEIRQLVCRALRDLCSGAGTMEEETELLLRRVCAVSSIDRKAEEPGLLAYAAGLGVPLLTYTAEELEQTGPAEAFSSSEFVRSMVGVDNVCERSAVLCSGGRLCMPKHAGNGVTAAAAERPVLLDGRREMEW